MEVLEQLNSQWRVVLESCSNTQANVRIKALAGRALGLRSVYGWLAAELLSC